MEQTRTLDINIQITGTVIPYLNMVIIDSLRVNISFSCENSTHNRQEKV